MNRSRSGTPLRSVDDSIVADTTIGNGTVNITMDENFDAEFLDEEFFDMGMAGDVSMQEVAVQ
jgi:hypothetical protein